MNVHGGLQLGFINLAVMQEDLAQEFLGIVRIRAHDHSVLEIDLFDDDAPADFERARLPACRQKLEHVSDTHCVESSANSHQITLWFNLVGRAFSETEPRVG